MPPFNSSPLTPSQRSLAAAHVGLVYTIVRSWLAQGDRAVIVLGEDDAIGEGLLALCVAARGFRREQADGTPEGEAKRFRGYVRSVLWSKVCQAAERWSRLPGEPKRDWRARDRGRGNVRKEGCH